MTRNLTQLTVDVLRRLSGVTHETSAVFNMSTQFGGGKTHTLTLLYHLAKNGHKEASHWPGVKSSLKQAEINTVPEANVAVFVGTEFDSIQGRGGSDGTPLRKTPWGELAWCLKGQDGFNLVKEHEEKGISPGGDVLRKLIQGGKPCLILMDEVMNYVSRNRHTGYGAQFYHFLQNLSEVVRGEKNTVLVVSIPASELEMTVEDRGDFDRIKKLLDRLGKAIVISSEHETAEIIRRRLFEWDGQAIKHDGTIQLNSDALAVCDYYAQWAIEHKEQLPSWFPFDNAKKMFEQTYPFHPITLSVFERKWQSLPRFQQTRGILRLLAQWVSIVYQDGYKNSSKEYLIALGTAPVDDSLFRRAAFEQLGEDRLETALTTDIKGKKGALAERLDKQGIEEIRKNKLHQKVAVSIFFESVGGQQQKTATIPEIRLAVGEPELELGHIDTVIDNLISSCYYLVAEGNKFKFSVAPNLNKILADRLANITSDRIQSIVKETVQKIFKPREGTERYFFVEKSNQLPDRPVLTFVVLAPNQFGSDEECQDFIKKTTAENGSSGRIFKSALIWILPSDTYAITDEARKLLAWKDIQDNET
ncbi:MAG: DUF499 domain-containing protein, partial [Candidatus Margulisiibacteriota bacterium]